MNKTTTIYIEKDNNKLLAYYILNGEKIYPEVIYDPEKDVFHFLEKYGDKPLPNKIKIKIIEKEKPKDPMFYFLDPDGELLGVGPTPEDARTNALKILAKKMTYILERNINEL